MSTVDINNKNIPFGGKIMIFGGDFRQILPVIRKGNKL
jgi:ATP-dependent DNA helicase PIF1